MKWIIDRTWTKQPRVLEWVTHTHKHHRKKPTVRIPVYRTELVPNKPGKNSWIARRG